MTRLIASALAAVFRFLSWIRNARTFHPDGRTFFGTVAPDPSHPTLARAGTMLEGRVLMRIGMGVVKGRAPAWIKRKLPDAPSVAVRFSSSTDAEDISVGVRAERELDVLFTAGGDRLWKLLLNLALGGRWFGLRQFDYFQNRYFADVRYRVPDCGANVWLRLTPETFGQGVEAGRAADPEAREQGLTEAASQGAVFLIEAQPVGDSGASFMPFARIRFDREIDIDQEALRFDPLSGRGFHPYGFLTRLRETVYPASAHGRPGSQTERRLRDDRGFLFRLFHGRHDTGEGASRRFGLKRLVYGFGLVCLALALAGAAYGAWRFLPNYSMTDPPDAPDGKYSQADIDAERFKYGSTGGEANLGFPILMWQAAPLVCADTLKKVAGDRIAADYVTRVQNYQPRADGGPDESRKALSSEGYKAFGLIYEKDKEDPTKERNIPVGASMRRNLGFDRVFVNCAFCHASTVRVSANAEPKLVLGMPANLLDIRDFEDFLFRCVSGPEFSRETVIPEIENMSGRLSLLDRYLIYPLAIWIVRDRVQFLSKRLGFFRKQPPWGPGRVDTFSNAKGIFNWPWKELPDWNNDEPLEPDQIGTVEFPSIWRQGARQTRSSDGCPMELHWDGNNDAVAERDLSAAFGTGALPTNIEHKTLGRVEDWLLLRSHPPKFIEFFPQAFDPELARLGKDIYTRDCADCHGVDGENFAGKYVGLVTPIDEIGTDRSRMDNYTEELAATQAMLYAGEKKPGWAPAAGSPDPLAKCRPQPHGDAEEHTYRFKRFRKTAGYANSPLDGVWLRAPYLHNGSVPTLRDLLKPPESRPTFYFRGNDEYDPHALGFKSNAAARPDGRAYFRFDTKHPGNSAQGHRYGTELPENDKNALIEYLKTF